MSNLTKIIAALQGGKRLTMDEIYNSEQVFESKNALSVSLHGMSTKEPRYLLREQVDGGKFRYWINPDVKLPAEVVDDDIRGRSDPFKAMAKQATQAKPSVVKKTIPAASEAGIPAGPEAVESPAASQSIQEQIKKMEDAHKEEMRAIEKQYAPGVQKACDDILAGIPTFPEPSGIRVRPQEKPGFFTGSAEGPYSVILADLMHKRGLLDNAINALQALSGTV